MIMMAGFDSWESELYHHGILGQKWGRRRWQNEDGSLTPEGIRRYGTRENYERIRNMKKPVRLMSDKELNEQTNRLRKEKELRDLTPHPVRDFLVKGINAYTEAKKQKAEREKASREMRIRELEAQAKVLGAKAQKKTATASIVSNAIGEGRAKKLDAKRAYKGSTIRGAISKLFQQKISKIEMPKHGLEAQAAKNEKILKLLSSEKKLKEMDTDYRYILESSLGEKTKTERKMEAEAKARRQRNHQRKH
jgi:hypothetical protein